MKHFLRLFVTTTATLFITTKAVPTIEISGDYQNFLIVAVVFFVVFYLAEHIVSLVFLPFHFLMKNLINIAAAAAVFFVLGKSLPFVSISPYDFPGFYANSFSLPPAQLNLLATLIAAGTVFTLVSFFVHWLYS